LFLLLLLLFIYCHPYIWTMNIMIHMIHLQFMRKHLLLKFSSVIFHVSCKFFIKYKYLFCWSK
jgi:hypothetical protein